MPINLAEELVPKMIKTIKDIKQ
ncbi:Protein of unknown function [Bacillus mycoides]|uniref:Uncharacterized protein n=1 Tax=Bacillus mycoides TaxID=1405 RepID=A0A1G4ERR0_BACMY|nr:Protein of unknown function [Bacillus mycoides]